MGGLKNAYTILYICVFFFVFKGGCTKSKVENTSFPKTDICKITWDDL